jgi:hypothetical protein
VLACAGHKLGVGLGFGALVVELALQHRKQSYQLLFPSEPELPAALTS